MYKNNEDVEQGNAVQSANVEPTTFNLWQPSLILGENVLVAAADHRDDGHLQGGQFQQVIVLESLLETQKKREQPRNPSPPSSQHNERHQSPLSCCRTVRCPVAVLFNRPPSRPIQDTDEESMDTGIATQANFPAVHVQKRSIYVYDSPKMTKKKNKNEKEEEEDEEVKLSQEEEEEEDEVTITEEDVAKEKPEESGRKNPISVKLSSGRCHWKLISKQKRMIGVLDLSQVRNNYDPIIKGGQCSSS